MVHCGWRHLAEMRHVNVEGTRVVARAARRAGARLIHVSSVDAIGLRSDGVPADEETPPGGMLECPYVVTKREAEAAVIEEVFKRNGVTILSKSRADAVVNTGDGVEVTLSDGTKLIVNLDGSAVITYPDNSQVTIPNIFRGV
jgi:2-polyprenyl-6-methoxyphenol hydroxylase-like FAD-dependent oxidoreductase